MDKYDRLYEMGEEHLLSLMKIECPRSMFESTMKVIFNEDDALDISGEMILIHLKDGNYTLSFVVTPSENNFTVFYHTYGCGDSRRVLFRVRGIPYDITEERHFQLSTQTHMPFSFEFHQKLKEFVEYCMKII